MFLNVHKYDFHNNIMKYHQLKKHQPKETFVNRSKKHYSSENPVRKPNFQNQQRKLR